MGSPYPAPKSRLRKKAALLRVNTHDPVLSGYASIENMPCGILA